MYFVPYLIAELSLTERINMDTALSKQIAQQVKLKVIILLFSMEKKL